MKRAFLATIALIALATTSATAADMAPIYKAPVVTAYNWTGFYIGGDVGVAWARKCWRFIGTDPDHGAPPGNEGCHNERGLFGGGQAGYNWQAGAWVVGVEAKWDWGRITAENIDLLDVNTINRTKVDSLALATARIGYAWNATMVYAKGGAAWARDTFEKSFIPGGGPFGAGFPRGGVYASASTWRVGWVVGAGIEYAVNPNWSVALEYDYLGFGDRTERLQDIRNFAFIMGIEQNVQLATIRLNYRFGGGPISARY